MPAAPDSTPARRQPALPLSVALALALAVWGFAAWEWSRPEPVAAELRHFRTLTDDGERMEAIERFGRRRDPRVTIALMEVVQSELARASEVRASGLLEVASIYVCEYHMPEDALGPAKCWALARMWWEANEAQVRRRAARLPR